MRNSNIIITNNHNLPEHIFKLAEHNWYTGYVPGVFASVSKLTGPPFIFLMNEFIKKNKMEISKDATDLGWTLSGHKTHYAMEKVNRDTEGILIEKTFATIILGKMITGTPDYTNIIDKIIEDVKETVVYYLTTKREKAIQKWTENENIYRLLAYRNGIQIDRLRINAFLKDWRPIEAVEKDGYPLCQMPQIELDIWGIGRTEKFVKEKIKLLEDFRESHIDNIITAPICSREDRFQDKTQYKVFKKGGSRAIPGGVFTDKSKAETLQKEKGDDYYFKEIIHPRKKCLFYCEFSKNFICPGFIEYIKNDSEALDLFTRYMKKIYLCKYDFDSVIEEVLKTDINEHIDYIIKMSK